MRGEHPDIKHHIVVFLCVLFVRRHWADGTVPVSRRSYNLALSLLSRKLDLLEYETFYVEVTHIASGLQEIDFIK
jgi:hypothetical protein